MNGSNGSPLCPNRFQWLGLFTGKKNKRQRTLLRNHIPELFFGHKFQIFPLSFDQQVTCKHFMLLSPTTCSYRFHFNMTRWQTVKRKTQLSNTFCSNELEQILGFIASCHGSVVVQPRAQPGSAGLRRQCFATIGATGSCIHEANTTLLRKKTGSGKFIDQTESNRIKPQIYPNRMKPNLKHLSKIHETEKNKCKSHTDLCCILKPG